MQFIYSSPSPLPKGYVVTTNTFCTPLALTLQWTRREERVKGGWGEEKANTVAIPVGKRGRGGGGEKGVKLLKPLVVALYLLRW